MDHEGRQSHQRSHHCTSRFLLFRRGELKDMLVKAEMVIVMVHPPFTEFEMENLKSKNLDRGENLENWIFIIFIKFGMNLTFV